jgi:hypothetical protein
MTKTQKERIRPLLYAAYNASARHNEQLLSACWAKPSSESTCCTLIYLTSLGAPAHMGLSEGGRSHDHPPHRRGRVR